MGLRNLISDIYLFTNIIYSRTILEEIIKNFDLVTVHELDSTQKEYMELALEILSGSITVKENPLLKRGDRIRVVADETQKRELKILVGCEVNRSEYIYITKDQTTIKEIIRKAG